MSGVRPGGGPTEVEKVLTLDDRAAAARTVLANAGIELTPWRKSRITAEQAEALAEVVKDWED